MLLSKLIAKLQDMKEKHGDVRVCLMMEDMPDIDNVSIFSEGKKEKICLLDSEELH